MKINRGSRGFTLLELLIVLTIIGVLAGLMFPVMAQQVEKSRAQEAVTALGTVKEALVKWNQISGNGVYTGASLASSDGSSWIGYDPNATAGGQVPLFTYLSTISPSAFTMRALPSGSSTNTSNRIDLTHNGAAQRVGVYQ